MAENILYYGDNLDILRRYIKDEMIGPLKRFLVCGAYDGCNKGK